MVCQRTTWGTAHPNLVIVGARCQGAPVGAEADVGSEESVMVELTLFEWGSAGEMSADWRGGLTGMRPIKDNHSPREIPSGCVIYLRGNAPRGKVAPVGREADGGRPVRCGVSMELLNGQQMNEMNQTSHQTPETKPTPPNQLGHSDSPQPTVMRWCVHQINVYPTLQGMLAESCYPS
jgi:hypothetical protein